MNAAFSICTYNIHKCRGLDTKMRPERIAAVIVETGADVVALQEVVRGPGERDQLEIIARELDRYAYCFGETRKIGVAPYGNAVLSRFPLRGFAHYDITASWREDRGCLRAELELPGAGTAQLFNVHLGTGYLERRKQGELLVGPGVLGDPRFAGQRIVLGDFNEWTRGLVTKLLAAHLHGADVRPFLKRHRSYPGVFPVMHLDHVYYDDFVDLTDFVVHRTRLAKIASDHLPLIAKFRLRPAAVRPSA